MEFHGRRPGAAPAFTALRQALPRADLFKAYQAERLGRDLIAGTTQKKQNTPYKSKATRKTLSSAQSLPVLKTADRSEALAIVQPELFQSGALRRGLALCLFPRHSYGS